MRAGVSRVPILVASGRGARARLHRDDVLKNPPTYANPAFDLVFLDPPFDDLAEKFIRHALDLTQETGGLVAMFLRNEYDMASTRDDLFEGHPAYVMKICVTKRPRWIEGSKGSPRHNYAWYVWSWENISMS